MQLLDTVVAYSAGSPVVEFIGEGGEKITVNLAPRPGASSDDLIEAARVMLVHAANFGAHLDETPEDRETANVDDTGKRDFRNSERLAGDHDEVEQFARENGITTDEVRILIEQYGNDSVFLIQAAKDLRERTEGKTGEP